MKDADVIKLTFQSALMTFYTHLRSVLHYILLLCLFWSAYADFSGRLLSYRSWKLVAHFDLFQGDFWISSHYSGTTNSEQIQWILYQLTVHTCSWSACKQCAVVLFFYTTLLMPNVLNFDAQYKMSQSFWSYHIQTTCLLSLFNWYCTRHRQQHKALKMFKGHNRDTVARLRKQRDSQMFVLLFTSHWQNALTKNNNKNLIVQQSQRNWLLAFPLIALLT